MGTTGSRVRRLGGWGFEGESYPPSPELLEWLDIRIDEALHPMATEAVSPPDIAPKQLPAFPMALSTEPTDRLAHARGQGLVDVVRLRAGRIPAMPDGVCRPVDPEQVEAALALCTAGGVRVIPWGGGTSVTGGVNVIADEIPVLSLDLGQMAGLLALDHSSGLATFGPGTTGPGTEAALAEHGLTLGHYPQSWELSTVGGWVVTRSSGQESLGYGRIEDMVSGLELVAPAGRLEIPAQPASAVGPNLRHLVMGSEGRLGVVTRVTLRVRPRPAATVVEGALFPELESALEAIRELVVSGVPLSLLRLSDAPETQVAMAIGLASSRTAGLVQRYLSLRGIGDEACLMLCGAAGGLRRTGEVMRRARSLIRSHRGVPVGRQAGRHWLRDRFHHPYLREGLLDLGYATDTLETAAPWSAVAQTRAAVRRAIEGALDTEGERVAVLCHISHPYRDGASLYFTFFFRCSADPDETIHRWAVIKRAACRALVNLRVTLSHHHGVGQWHAPFLEHEIGSTGRMLIESAARELDPDRVLNPHVLLDPTDRLEA
jgi:alkyldihydroxyacetonephosphate synthase